ncbi:hypothetical protein RFI_25556, partial [Reticulomyxa filosa]
MIDRTKIMIERMINRFVSTSSLLSSIDSNINENINKNINENINKSANTNQQSFDLQSTQLPKKCNLNETFGQTQQHFPPLKKPRKSVTTTTDEKERESTLNTRPKQAMTTTESDTLKSEWQRPKDN